LRILLRWLGRAHRPSARVQPSAGQDA